MDQFEYLYGRDFSAYEQGMNATLNIKWRQIRPWIVADGGALIDEGCGTGQFLARLARSFPSATVIGRDISSHLLTTSREAVRNLGNAHVLAHNIATRRLPERSVATKIYSSVWHEIFSYQGYKNETLRTVLAATFNELIPGGRIIIRDGVRPHHETVALQLVKERPAPTIPSVREMFIRFVRDFNATRPVFYGHLQTSDYQLFSVLGSQDAYEFLMKKDYVANWEGEIKEVFGVWSKDEFIQELEATGFQIIHIHLYRNPWIVRNRLKPSIRMFRFTRNGRLVPMPFPATNIIVVGEKPK